MDTVRLGVIMNGVTGRMGTNQHLVRSICAIRAISHGSARRINEGERRIAVFRYGPHWGNTRFGYRQLLEADAAEDYQADNYWAGGITEMNKIAARGWAGKR